MRSTNHSITSIVLIQLLVVCSTGVSQDWNTELASAQTEEELIAVHQRYNRPRGDIDGDGETSFTDLLTLAMFYDQPVVDYRQGDLDLDGVVGLRDFAIINYNLGQFSYIPPLVTSSTPEANFGFHKSSESELIISSEEPRLVSAAEILSSSRGIVSLSGTPHTDAAPLPFSVNLGGKEGERLGWAHLATATMIDGDVHTGFTAAHDEVTLRWIEPGNYQVFSTTLGGGDAVTGRPIDISKSPAQPVATGPQPMVAPDLDLSRLDPRFGSVHSEGDLIDLHRELNTPRGSFDEQGLSLSFNSFQHVVGNFGKTATGYLSGDVNLNGTVELGDVAIAASNFGSTQYSAEPPDGARDANLGLSLDDNQRVIISSRKRVEIGGLEIQSNDDGLLYDDEQRADFPFPLLLAETAGRVAWAAAPNGSVRLDGDLASYVVSSSSNLSVNWFERGSYSVHSLAYGEGDASTRFQVGQPRLQEFPVLYSRLEELGPEFEVAIGNLFVTDVFDGIEEEADLIAEHRVRDLPRGDLSGDGRVDFTDVFLFQMRRTFNQDEEQGYQAADLNLDGINTDFTDRAILATNYGAEGFSEDGTAEPVLLTAAINEDGFVVIDAEHAVAIGGIEMLLSDGIFVPKSEDANEPFFMMEQASEERLYWSIMGHEDALVFDEPYVTDIYVESTEGAVPHIDLRWFQDGSYQVFDATLLSPAIVGDLDGDGTVGFLDFLIVSTNFGNRVSSLTEGDIDGDGKVGFEDFLVLSSNFGQTPSAHAVPEPTGWCWLGLMTCWLFACSRRRRRAYLGAFSGAYLE